MRYYYSGITWASWTALANNKENIQAMDGGYTFTKARNAEGIFMLWHFVSMMMNLMADMAIVIPDEGFPVREVSV